MKAIRVAFILMLFWTMAGCSLLAGFYKPGPNGEPSTASTVQSIVRNLPYGELIASAIGLVGLGVGGERHMKKRKLQKDYDALKAKHDALIAAGKKDDNNDGVDDALQAPPAPTT